MQFFLKEKRHVTPKTHKSISDTIIRNSLFVCGFVCLSGLLLGNGKAHKAQTRWVGGA